MDFDVRFITKDWGHHSSHSGYNQLVRWLGSRIEPVDQNIFRKWIPGRVAVWLANRSGNDLYSYLAFYSEWTAMRDMMLNRNPNPLVYHVLFADDSYRYLGALGRGHNTRLVATYHLPPNALKEYLHSLDCLKKLDGLIVVGTNQIPFFEPIVGSQKIFFIPHGIDTEIFIPDHNQQVIGSSKSICLFVGVHRRDFLTLRHTIQLINKLEREIRFIIVTAKSNERIFEGLHNIEVKCDISEPDLIKLYQTADILVQTLEDSTANNAILEGMACGLPIIATDIGSVRDYVNEQCAILVPYKNPEATADAIISLMKNDSIRHEMGIASREKATQYDWSLIVEATNQVYSTLFN